MKFAEIIAQIKAEARVKQDAEFDSVVIALFNEMFKEATESQRPFELRAEVVLPVAAVTGIVTLPDDFFVYHQIIFEDSDTARTYPLIDQDKASQPAPRGMYGHPKSFEVASGQILLKPTLAIVTGDNVRLVYYKIPPIVTLQNTNDTNPISRMEPFIIRAVIRRIRMLHTDDVQVAQMFTSDVASAANAYTKDEPERDTRSNPGRG